VSTAIAIYGAGGHGKVVADILLAGGHAIETFLDDNSAHAGGRILGLPVCSAEVWLASNAGARVALGIGDNRARERAAIRVRDHGCELLTAIHPASIVSTTAKITAGVAVMAAAVLNPDCEIGEGAIINTSAVVEHDVRVGRYAHLSPRCATGGGAHIGAYAHLGIGAIVLPQKRVGANAVVGAGAVVIADIADYQVASGVPARVHSRHT
jgi:sugar O-acyltransferase (sialic acid O-acetyltransferase NeuD family)